MSNMYDKNLELLNKLIDVRNQDTPQKMTKELQSEIMGFMDSMNGDIISTLSISLDKWAANIYEYIKDTINLYLEYHLQGRCSGVVIKFSQRKSPVIEFKLDGLYQILDFEKFKYGTDEGNRESHRECYYRDESIWYEFTNSEYADKYVECIDLVVNFLTNEFPNLSFKRELID